MQVAKIVGMLALVIGILFLASCYGGRVSAEEARAVDYEDYGGLGGISSYDGYRLEEFMDACGAVTFFMDDGANILAECNGWALEIETYKVESDLEEPFWCTQVLLSRDGNATSYAFGHVKGAMPRVVSQPRLALVRSAGIKPWRQRVERSTLEDLIELMTSGNLLEEREDPLEGLSFSYLEINSVTGEEIAHYPSGQESPVTTDLSDH